MTAESFQQLEEKIARRAEEISLSGGSDLTVAICAWTADTRVVVLEWFNGNEPQREIIGGIPQPDNQQDQQPEIQPGRYGYGDHQLEQRLSGGSAGQDG